MYNGIERNENSIEAEEFNKIISEIEINSK